MLLNLLFGAAAGIALGLTVAGDDILAVSALALGLSMTVSMR